MIKNLFKKKEKIEILSSNEANIALRLMLEIAISDGSLDASELKLIEERADSRVSGNEKASNIIRRIIHETEKSVSFYPTIKKINETHSHDKKIELLTVLWELVKADSKIDPYEENLYFKIAELIKIKRTIANKIKQQTT